MSPVSYDIRHIVFLFTSLDYHYRFLYRGGSDSVKTADFPSERSVYCHSLYPLCYVPILSDNSAKVKEEYHLFYITNVTSLFL